MTDPGRDERRDVCFRGRVQGVGFRYTVQALARRTTVTGYVQNMADGAVRLVAEGPPGELEGLIEAIGRHRADHIADTQVQRLPATGEFGDFRIQVGP